MVNDLISRFTQAAKKVGCQVTEAQDVLAAGRYIADLAKAKQAKLVQTSSHDLVEQLELRSVLNGSEILVSGPDPGRLLMADLGVSDAVVGIAETGSLLTHHDPVDSRLVTMLPLTHVAILKREALVESLEDGIVEAIEHPGHPFLVAVQWHPERMYQEHAEHLALFQALVVAAGTSHAGG